MTESPIPDAPADAGGLADRLEPFVDTIDVTIIRIRDLARHDIHGNPLADSDPGFLSVHALRRLRTCGFQIKAVWYRLSRVKELDAAYATLVDQILAQPVGAPHSFWFERLPEGRWRYFPFFQAMELADLLNAASACVETFCQGVGAFFKNEPNRLAGLAKVLSAARPREPLAENLLDCVRQAETQLHGLVVDPGPPKKALRDLMQHREHAPIHFSGDAASRPVGAFVQMDHPLLVRFANRSVVYLAETTWHACHRLVETGFPLVVSILEKRRGEAAGVAEVTPAT